MSQPHLAIPRLCEEEKGHTAHVCARKKNWGTGYHRMLVCLLYVHYGNMTGCHGEGSTCACNVYQTLSLLKGPEYETYPHHAMADTHNMMTSIH